MNYQEEYKSKLVTAREALLSLKDGDVIGTSQNANEPSAIFDEFHVLLEGDKHFKMYVPMCFKQHDFLSNIEYKRVLDMDITFLTASTRKSYREGLFNYYPASLHNGACRWVKENGCTVFIGAVAPMDEDGNMKMSLSLIHERVFLESADKVILQVNPKLPCVYGDTDIHISQVDMIVEAESDLPYIPKSEPNEVEKAIGKNVASLVNDGDTLQLGIGGIPDAAAMSLLDKKDLGIHTEMITNSIVDLVKSGAITGTKKTYLPGKIVGTFAMGTQELYDLLDHNPNVLMLSGTTVNNPSNVAKNDNFVSVNSCIQLDLSGQICSESIGSMQYSGSGGQSDMAVGATHSKGGRNIIAVASTKKKGTISTIVSVLDPGSIVTLSRNEVDYVVTEYGIAKLRGQALHNRVKNLISVAHPDFRERLEKEAKGIYSFL